MTIKNSGVLSPIAVIERIQGLIMERFHEAFLKVDAAMDELGPEDEDEKNLFGYNLYYTVQREMRKLDGMVPSLTVESKANRTKSANHAELRLDGIVSTFSSARWETGLSRFAVFRMELMQPRLFDTGPSGEVVSPLHPDKAYVEIVYGRRGRKLAFVKAVCRTTPQQEVLFLFGADKSDASSGRHDQVEQVNPVNWFGE
jgi:hypothetical protein